MPVTPCVPRYLWRLLGLFVGVTMAFAACYVLPVAWAALALPPELRSAVFVLPGTNSSVFYTPQMFGFSTRSVPGRILTVADGSRGETRFAAEGKALPALRFHELSLMLKTTPGSVVSLSPDGSAVVFAQQIASTSATSTRSWNIYVAPGHAPEPYSLLATGFVAFYLDATHILRFTETGIYRMDLSQATSTQVRAEPFPTVPSFLSLSPDRSRVAWTTFAHTTTVYAVTPEGLELIATLPRQFSSNARLGTNGIYELRSTSIGTELWKTSFEGTAERIQTLPFYVSMFAL